MVEAGLITSKVRSFMEQLSPMARALLVRSLRSGGGDIPSEIILAAVEGLEIAPEAFMAAVRGGEPWSERLEKAFFAPLEPFLTDDELPRPVTGRLPRRHLAPIWNWIRRDLAPAAWEQALAADPLVADADPAPVARRLRRDVAGPLVERLREVGADPRARQKLGGHLGGEPVFRTLSDLAYVFVHETAFAELAAQLPSTVTAFDVVEPSRFVDAVRAAFDQGTMAADWIAASVLARTAAPVVAINLAALLAGTTDPRQIAAGRYAPLVDGVLDRLEHIAAAAAARTADVRGRDAFLADLRAYRELDRAVELALPVASVSAWARRRGAACASLSEVVTGRLEAAPGLVRRALRFEPQTGWSTRFDDETFADAEFAVRVTLEARNAVDALAINEVSQRARKQVESTLELMFGRLMTELKSPALRDRELLLAAIDGAIRLSALVFGEDYAAMLRKSRDLALQRPARAG